MRYCCNILAIFCGGRILFILNNIAKVYKDLPLIEDSNCQSRFEKVYSSFCKELRLSLFNETIAFNAIIKSTILASNIFSVILLQALPHKSLWQYCIFLEQCKIKAAFEIGSSGYLSNTVQQIHPQNTRMSSNCALCLAASSSCISNLLFYCYDKSFFDKFETVTAKLRRVSTDAVSSYLYLVLIALQTSKVSLLFLNPSFSKATKKVHNEVQEKSGRFALTPSWINFFNSCLSVIPTLAILFSIIDSEDEDTFIICQWFQPLYTFYFCFTIILGGYESSFGCKISVSLVYKRERSLSCSCLQFLVTPHSKIAVSSKVRSLILFISNCLSCSYNCDLLYKSTRFLNIKTSCSILNLSIKFYKFCARLIHR